MNIVSSIILQLSACDTAAWHQKNYLSPGTQRQSWILMLCNHGYMHCAFQNFTQLSYWLSAVTARKAIYSLDSPTS